MGPPWGAFCQITLTSCFTKLGKMTGADKVMNPQHFGRDLADIRIQINPAIQIGIPDRFWLKSWCWRRFASLSTVLLCLCSCVVGHRWIVSKLLNKSNLYTWYGVDEGTVMLNGGSVPPQKNCGFCSPFSFRSQLQCCIWLIYPNDDVILYGNTCEAVM